MKYYFAPLEGVTKSDFRRIHHKYFPGADKYYTPFISPTQEHLFTARELDEILPERNEGLPVVPQILTNSAENFIWAARELRAMGYREVNFNLGCPSQTVTAKRKGSGLLAFPEMLEGILSEIFSALDIKISVKTRLGMVSPDEFGQILEIYNKFPICELTVHTRVQKDFYKLPARPEAFARYAGSVAAPLCYNGDIFSPGDCAAVLSRFPNVEAVMLGRGLIRNPALIGLIKGDAMPEKALFRAFHDELFAAYKAKKWSDNAILCHMKELWAFMGDLFENSEKQEKAIRKSKRLEDYISAAADIFSLPIKSNFEEVHI
ncbi:MAG: tRNA-dihydrouridine synthase family protein [Clostridiales bacterium]|nr:tRNA-dihydrouridine synthase family protein [Clostridiales bacterium]